MAAAYIGIALGVGALSLGRCEVRAVAEVPSPSGDHVAAYYVRQCGPLTPVHSYVGVGRADDPALTAVATIRELAWNATLRWRSDNELVVTFDCESRACSARDDTYWSVDGRPQWNGVQVTYAVSRRLQQGLSRRDLLRLPTGLEPMHTGR